MVCWLCLIASCSLVHEVLQATACGDNITCPHGCHIVCQTQVAEARGGSTVRFGQLQAKSCEGSSNGGVASDAATVCCESDFGEVCCASAAVNAGTAVDSSHCPPGKIRLTNMTKPTNALRGPKTEVQGNRGKHFQHWPVKILTTPKKRTMSGTFGLLHKNLNVFEVAAKVEWGLDVMLGRAPGARTVHGNFCHRLASSMKAAIDTLPPEPLGYAYWCFQSFPKAVRGVFHKIDFLATHLGSDIASDPIREANGANKCMCMDRFARYAPIKCLIVKVNQLQPFLHDELEMLLSKDGYSFALGLCKDIEKLLTSPAMIVGLLSVCFLILLFVLNVFFIVGCIVRGRWDGGCVIIAECFKGRTDHAAGVIHSGME